MFYSVLVCVVLVGLSSGLNTGPFNHLSRRRRSDNVLTRTVIRLENLKTILDEEQFKNRQLQTEMTEMKERLEKVESGVEENLKTILDAEQLKNRQLQTEMTEMKERLEKIESGVEENSCPCREMISTQSSVSNIQLSNIEEGLRREKTSRYTLENEFELLKAGQKDDQNTLVTLDKRIKEVQTNMSKILPDCAEKCEVGRIKLVTLDKEVRALQANMSDVVSLCKKTDGERIKQKACPPEFIKLETGCYYFELNQYRNYEDARTECQKKESSLVTVETVAERDEIAEYIRERFVHLFGFQTSGRRISGEWKWIGDNNQQSSISTDVLDNWRPGDYVATGYNCLYFSKFNGQWYNYLCNEHLFICEI